MKALVSFDSDGKLIEVFPIVETDCEEETLRAALAPLLGREEDAE